jgi:hypothetical protein
VAFTIVTLRKEDEPLIEQSAAERIKTSIGTGLQNGSVARFLAEEQCAVARAQQITLIDRQGKVLSGVGEAALCSQPTLSRDGNRVAAIKTDRDSGDSDVWVFDIGTGKARESRRIPSRTHRRFGLQMAASSTVCPFP